MTMPYREIGVIAKPLEEKPEPKKPFLCKIGWHKNDWEVRFIPTENNPDMKCWFKSAFLFLERDGFVYPSGLDSTEFTEFCKDYWLPCLTCCGKVIEEDDYVGHPMQWAVEWMTQRYLFFNDLKERVRNAWARKWGIYNE